MRTLPADLAKLFYQLNNHLMAFANEQYNIVPILKTADDIADCGDQDALLAIQEKTYMSDNIRTFCKDNPYFIEEKTLKYIMQWQHSIVFDGYMVRHMAKHTVLLKEEKNKPARLYGIKGLYDDIDDIIPSQALPLMVRLRILPFAGYLIYSGLIQHANVYFGGGYKRSLNETFQTAKALRGIYETYHDGDDLASPPALSSLKEQVAYEIKQAREFGEFPTAALKLAESQNEPELFETLYTKRHASIVKRQIKNNPTLPTMYYAMYRESVIAVMPNKKELMAFCGKHYPDLLKCLTIFKAGRT